MQVRQKAAGVLLGGLEDGSLLSAVKEIEQDAVGNGASLAAPGGHPQRVKIAGVMVRASLAFMTREHNAAGRDVATVGYWMQAWLSKRGPMLGYAFQKRWTVLTPTALIHYKDDTSSSKLSVDRLKPNSRAVRFTKSSAPGEAVKHRKEKPFGFVLDVDPDAGKERRLSYYDAEEGALLDFWIMNITQVVEMRSQAVTLHLYDVTTRSLPSTIPEGKDNPKINAIGTGTFHVAIEVRGSEWSYGACDAEEGSGVFQCTSAPTKFSSNYREAVEIGYTSKSEDEVLAMMSTMRAEWLGKDYDQVAHNCCHFCAAVSEGLGLKMLPPWIMDLAEIDASMKNGGSSKAHGTKVLNAAKAGKKAPLNGEVQAKSAPTRPPDKPPGGSFI